MRIGVLTGGGDCPGLNPAIRGVVYRATEFGDEVVGILDGWKGLVKGDTEPLDRKAVEEIISRGGTILGTSRTNPYKKPEDLEAAKRNFKGLNLDALVAIGGEDTLGVASKLHLEGFKVVGVPKTMDNDLSETDFTFGFDTAVSVAVDALERLRDTAKSHRRIFVFEVMGRHAGWVALYTALAGGADAVLLPEEPVDLAKLAAQVKAAYARKRYAIVVVSEGTELPDAAAGAGETTKDAFGHTILGKRAVGERVAAAIERELKMELRTAVVGHIQRGGSPTVFDRILGTRVGAKAVELIHEGKFGQMACLHGTSIEGAPLDKATGTLKLVTKDWLDLARMFCK